MAFSLKQEEIMREVQYVKEFRGDDTQSLYNFIREVQSIVSLTTTEGLRDYIGKNHLHQNSRSSN